MRVFEESIGERHEDGTVDPRKVIFVYKGGYNPPPYSPVSGNKTCSYAADYTCGDGSLDVCVQLSWQMLAGESPVVVKVGQPLSQ